uniref:Uncharacterized protein n=1 Tax=viral metagenome TaxID=1070528 RepID=A0A6C0KVH5_9ZZZZ
MKEKVVTVEVQMTSLAEKFLRRQIAKSQFSLKTILELVTLLLLQSRDTAVVVKTIQDLYASDFMKAHLASLPGPIRTKLDTLVSTGLADFVELAVHSLPKPATWSWFPRLCGGIAPVAVIPPIDPALEKIANSVTDVSGSILDKIIVTVDVSGATTLKEAEKVVAETLAQVVESAVVPVIAAVPVLETSATVATTDVSGAQVDATLVAPAPVVSV